MASIRTGIELNDGFTSVLNHIVSSVNLTISAMEDMQRAMNADVDTASLEDARNEINQVTMAANELEQVLSDVIVPAVDVPQVDQGMQSPVNVDVNPVLPDPLVENPEPIRPEVQPRAPTEPVEVPFEWQSYDGLDVFIDTGADRFHQELSSLNDMMNQVNATQYRITQAANESEILSPEASYDVQELENKLYTLFGQIQRFQDTSLEIGTDEANNQLERLRSQMMQLQSIQSNLNQAMDSGNVEYINDAYLRLTQSISSAQRYVRDTTIEQEELNDEINEGTNEQEEFNQRIQEGTSQADKLMNTIKNAVAAYVSLQGVGKALSISDELIQTTSRLDMMNDGAQTTQELVNMVYAAAQDARGSFMDMADVVARFGNNAKDAFGSSEEVVAFADLIQKQMTIAGASTQEAANAELQLSQALGSGVLRGDELNSIFEQAPNLIQSIADYLEVPIGQIREMASEGELSADVVKAAIFASADDINEKFDEMPMTWAQIWQSMQNTALIAFQPVLKKLNDIGNSKGFQAFVNGAIEAMAALANATLNAFDLMASGAAFVADNWSVIGPIIYGIIGALAVYGAYLAITKGIEMASTAAKIVMCAASYAHAAAMGTEASAMAVATAAQYNLNTALLSCPIFWIITGVIALIAILVALCNWIANVTGLAQSGIGIIVGTLAVAASFIANLVFGLVNVIIMIGINLWNLIANFAAAMGIIFNDPIAAIKAAFLSLLDFIVSVVTAAASLLDHIFGSNLADAVSGFQAKIQSEIDATVEGAGGTAGDTLNPEDYTLGRINYGDAFSAGAAWGDGIADKIGNFKFSNILGKTNIPNVDDYTSGFTDAINSSGLGSGIDDIAGDTGSIKDSLDCTQEDLKYLRDIAEQEAVNRFTIAEVKVEQTNHNNINSGMDLDGVVSGLTDAVNEAVDSITEGVHA